MSLSTVRKMYELSFRDEYNYTLNTQIRYSNLRYGKKLTPLILFATKFLRYLANGERKKRLCQLHDRKPF